MGQERRGLIVSAWSAEGVGDRLRLDNLTAAWLISRVLCFAAGIVGVVVLGSHPGPFDPGNLTAPFGTVGNDLVAPAARWDSHWYLLIATHGYQNTELTHFYPLFPLLARIVGTPLDSSLLGGIVVSLACLLVALKLLARLVTLDLAPELGTRTALLLAFYPMAVVFSAVYTESLLLALTIGAVYAARKERWALAGVAGGLATLTHPTGFLVIVPLTLLYLYGPRGEEPGARSLKELWPPRYRPRRDALWLLGVPAGFGVYMLYLGVALGHPLAMIEQAGSTQQHFTFPLLTVARAARLAGNGLVAAAHSHAPSYVYEFVVLLVAIAATVGCLRRFPLAYTAYAAGGILFIVSFPLKGEVLAGFSRYVSPLFPILMWLAAWTSERRLYRPLLVVFGMLMLVYSVRFATWHPLG